MCFWYPLKRSAFVPFFFFLLSQQQVDSPSQTASPENRHPATLTPSSCSPWEDGEAMVFLRAQGRVCRTAALSSSFLKEPKVVFCISNIKLLNKTFKVLLWSDAHRSDKWNNSQTTVTSRCFLSKGILFFNYTKKVSQKLEYFIDQNLMCALLRFWDLLLHEIKCAWILKQQSWDLFH